MLDGLTTDQRDAVAHPGGPMVVVAGAGAGKTTVLSRRLAWLVAEGAAPAAVLALTFTQKAAAELRGRAEDLLGRSHETLRVMTFHAWARDLVRTHGVEPGLLAPRDIIGEEERALMMLDRLAELDLRHYDMRGDPATVVERLIARIDRFRDNLVPAERALAWARDRVDNAGRPAERARAERELEFATAFVAHDRWLEEAGLEDFGGSLSRAITLLRDEPAAHSAACESTRHVLVDEFQDTNYAQAQLLYEVSDRAESVVVVGDDDQGIYRFRGASTKNIADFRHRYPGCAEARLVVNFRSHQRILDASGAVVAPLPDRDPKELRAAEGSEGPSPRLWCAPDPAGEARAVAAEIRRLADAGMPYEEQAVLMRAVRLEARPIIEALEAEGLPYQVRGGMGLFERREVRDAMAWLRAVTDPADAVAHLRVASDASWGLPWPRVAAVTAEADGGPIVDDVAEVARQAGADRYLSTLDSVGQEAVRGTPREAMRAAIDRTGLRARALALGGAEGAARLAGLAGLEHLASAVMDRDPDLDAAGLAARLVELARVGHRGAELAGGEPIGVQVMTVHQAKGLEFDAVFVVGLSLAGWPGRDRSGPGVPEALLPESLPPEKDAHIAESRRLAYVALTRPRHQLVLSMAAMNERGVPQRPSPFFEEAGGAIGAEAQEVGQTATDDDLHRLAALRERFEQATLAAAEAADGDDGGGARAEAMAAAEALIEARAAARHPAPPDPAPAPAPRPARPGQSVSVTDIVTYRRCPLQYRFRHVDRIPPAPGPERDIGIAVHSALEAHYRPEGDGGDGERLVKRVERELERRGVTETPEGRQALRRAREQLPGYHERHGRRGEKVAVVEWDFTLSLGPHRVRGRVDRIDKYPDGYQLVDYKTGAPPKAPGGGEGLPLKLYAAGLLDTHDRLARGGSLHYVLDGEARPVDTEAPEVEAARDEAGAAADGIAAGDFDPTPGWHCRSCDFALLCPEQDR